MLQLTVHIDILSLNMEGLTLLYSFATSIVGEFDLYSMYLETSAPKSLIASGTGNQWKKPSYFPLYWLVNRDPYNGLL